MRIRRPTHLGGALLALGLAIPALSLAPAGAASSAIVGTAASFSVLGGSAVTNTGPTVLTQDLGVAPQPDITGFPPGLVGGTTHADDAVAQQAQSDLTAGYDDLAGRASNGAVAGDLAGLTFTPGVYTSASSLLLTGTVTLDAEGDPDALFIFQIGSTLTTETDSVVSLVDGASPCNVYWQVGSSATLGTDSTFVGTLVALTSITATTDATVEGQLLARNGAVTLDTNVIDSSTCAAASPGGGATTTTSTTTVAATTPTTTVELASAAPTAPAATAGPTATSVPTTTAGPGGSATGTPVAAPQLPATGPNTVPAVVATLLVLAGVLLLWWARPVLLHSPRRWFR